MPACIYFHPDAYTTAGRQVMGRHAAGESFLRGYFTHGRRSDLWVQVEDRAHARAFEATARSFGRREPVRVVDAASLPGLAAAGSVFHPYPGLAEHAWQRSFHGAAAWSLCGITHTTASARAMDAITDWLTAPVQPWDAVICTSHAVRGHVQRLLEAQAEFLRQRLGVERLVLPRLPVIPLGVHADDFVGSAAERDRARLELGATAETRVVLFMGRLSFHAKAHPLAMYQALERVVREGQGPVLLLECGWHANDSIRAAFAEAAALACPGVPVRTLDGRDAGQRRIAWAAADVFCSLADNIQETFGITPLEAMAAGLPVVVSDWDGYRDTVQDGVEGFRIPTLMPAAGLGGDLAGRHALGLDTYDAYCGYTCALVGVDVEATAAAFRRLFASAELRQRMGEAGRRRVRELYDWSVIIPRYEALADELAALRRQAVAERPDLASPPANTLQHWPARMDPLHGFAGYPTLRLEPATRLALVDPTPAEARVRLQSYLALAMVRYAIPVLPSGDELSAVLEAAAGGPRPALALVQGLPPERRPLVFRTLAWLVKLDLLRQEPAPG